MIKSGIEYRNGSAFVSTQLSVETQVGEQTPNQQQRQMHQAGNAGGNRARMLPQNARSNPNFI